MKSFRKAQWLCFVLGLIVFSVCPVVYANVQKPPVITVAFPETMGINEVYEDGTYGGCVYDWLKEIAKYTGWEYEFVTGDAGELTNAMIAGEYDLMGSMYWAEGYDEYFNYPRYVMGFNYNLLIYRRDNPNIKSYDYTTLNGKKFGVYEKAFSKIERLEKFLDFNKIQYELVYFENVKDYENCLETGEADVMLGSDTNIRSGYNVAAKFAADPYYIVTAKDKPELCEQLSEAMELIYAANPNFAEELYNKYFPNRYYNSISFNMEEQAFIQQSPPLRVAVIKEQFPLYYEQDGKVMGVVPECLELVSQRTGLSFEFVFTDTYQGLLDLVVQGNADIIGAFRNGDNSSAELGLVRTVSYVSLDSVILRNKQSFGKSQGLIMAVPKGRDIKPSSINDSIIFVETYKDCIEAVNSGKADYTRMSVAFIEDFYFRDYYANTTIVADTALQEDLTFGMTVPVNVPLYSILSKALNNFSDEESANLLKSSTLTLRKNKVTLKTLFYTNPIMVTGICVGIVLLISVIVILINFNRTRTRVMQMKLEKAEEMNRAKSNFLSRMSHEIRTPMNAIIGLTNLTRMTGEATPTIDKALSKIDSSAQFLLSLLNDVLDMSKIENQKMQLDNAPFNLEHMIFQVKNMFVVQADCQGLKLEVDCQLQHPSLIGDKMSLQRVLTNLVSNACKFTERGGIICLAVEEKKLTAEAATLRFSVKDTGIGIRQEDVERIFRAFEQAKLANRRTQGTGLGLAISSSLVELMGGTLELESQLGVGSEFYFTITLPIFDGELSENEDKTELSETQLDGLSILLVEDNDINAEIAIELLKNRNMIVDWASDGQKAVEMFSKSQEGVYDIILMDINMPIMDGLTATKTIRAMNRQDAGIVPILAMTANAFKEDRRNAAQAGMTGFLPKPFNVDQLYQVLLESLEERHLESERDGD